MRKFEIAVAVVVALAAFVVVKLIGLVVKVALVAAVLGLVAGFVLARALRSPGRPAANSPNSRTDFAPLLGGPCRPPCRSWCPVSMRRMSFAPPMRG
jgi:hypothetical protein